MENVNEGGQELYDTLVNRIINERENQKISKAEMARRLEMNSVSYGDKESGKSKFSAIQLFAALEVLGINIGMKKDNIQEDHPPSEDELLKKLNKLDKIDDLSKEMSEVKNLLKAMVNPENLQLLLELTKSKALPESKDNQENES